MHDYMWMDGWMEVWMLNHDFIDAWLDNHFVSSISFAEKHQIQHITIWLWWNFWNFDVTLQSINSKWCSFANRWDFPPLYHSFSVITSLSVSHKDCQNVYRPVKESNTPCIAARDYSNREFGILKFSVQPYRVSHWGQTTNTSIHLTTFLQ